MKTPTPQPRRIDKRPGDPMNSFRAIILGGAALTALLHAAAPANAAGFGLRENSAVAEGEADAADATGAAGLSAITGNPAGLTFLDGNQIEASVTYVGPSSDFHPSAASTSVAGVGTFPIRGTEERDPMNEKPIPTGYAMLSPTADLRLAIGVTVPFGLSTSYAADSAVRYQALFSKVATIDINPTAAYRINDWLSVGAGFSAQRLKAAFTNAIDFGTLVPATLAGLGIVSPAIAGALIGAGGGVPANDGRADLYGTSWGFGWNVGVVATPLSGTKLGVSYRSSIEHTIEGRANFSVPSQYAALAAATGQFAPTTLSADVALPAILNAGVTQRLTDRLSVDLTYQWMEWSRFKTLGIQFANPHQAPVFQPQNYRDTSTVAIGANYAVDEALTVRAGFSWDQTPTNGIYADYRVIDGDRYILAGGATYVLAPGIAISGSYKHLFVATANLGHPETIIPGVENFVAATASNNVDVLAATLTAGF